MNRTFIWVIASTMAFAAGVGAYALWFTLILPTDYELQGPHVELAAPGIAAAHGSGTMPEEQINLRPCVGPDQMKRPRPRTTRSDYTAQAGLLNWRAVCGPLPTFTSNVDAIGSVLLEVLVDEQGEVVTAKPLSGHALLVVAAVEAASKTRFAPVTVGGEFVKVHGRLRYEFSQGEVRLTMR